MTGPTATADILALGISVGDRLRFDGKSTSWLVRAVSKDGRWVLCTASMFGSVYYSIIDRDRVMRGPMNVIGWGLGIFTTRGPDPAVDDAMARLEGSGEYAGWAGQWSLSHRGELPLTITDWRRA